MRGLPRDSSPDSAPLQGGTETDVAKKQAELSAEYAGGKTKLCQAWFRSAFPPPPQPAEPTSDSTDPIRTMCPAQPYGSVAINISHAAAPAATGAKRRCCSGPGLTVETSLSVCTPPPPLSPPPQSPARFLASSAAAPTPLDTPHLSNSTTTISSPCCAETIRKSFHVGPEKLIYLSEASSRDVIDVDSALPENFE